jgi:hypothetical protein
MLQINKKSEPIVVYWAPEAILEKEHQQIMLDIALRPVISDIQKRRNKTIIPAGPNIGDPHANGYHKCTALHELTKNMFYIKAPFSVDIEFDDSGKIKRGQNYSGWFHDRETSLKNGNAADFDLCYMFFCEESLDVSITPPYLHKTSQPEYGYVSAVKWDIGSWFRPFVLIYQLWEGKKKIYFEKDEPLAYLNFHTDREIIFKEYKINQEIINITNACLRHKTIIPLETMKKLYDRFTKTSMKKRLLSEIKKNLIEDLR